MKPVEELKLIVQNQPDKVIIGSNKTLELLKLSRLSKIYLSKNAPESVVKDIDYYSKLSNVDVIRLDINNEELGALLKKPFKVAVVSILK